MRTSSLFGAKNFRFFEIYCVSARTRGRGVEPVRTFFEQGERGFVRGSLRRTHPIESHSVRIS